MMISTRGRYALRVMVDMVRQNTAGFIPLSDVAERQGISEKYLESIVSSLAKKGLLDSVRGKGGGYKLNRPADEYTVADILNATEGPMAPVACLKCNENSCPRKDTCPTLPLWTQFYQLTTNFFEGITIQQLVDGNSDL